MPMAPTMSTEAGLYNRGTFSEMIIRMCFVVVNAAEVLVCRQKESELSESVPLELDRATQLLAAV